MSGRLNLHATALVADGAGLLIEGASGTGKSALAHALIETFRSHGRFAVLVADDRVWLSAVNGRLVAEVPEAIAGLIELRGYGPAPLPHERRAVIDRAVVLVEPASAQRLPAIATRSLLGIDLPRLDLARGDTAGAARAAAAWLMHGDYA